ncbi:hypothetical protein B0T12DRAFT_413878 [Alternaria alternata]|nr:hypothetical protein B0T12DRAFT_413878 [Alternaria alternata]
MSQPRSLGIVCTSGLRFGTLSAMFVGGFFDLRDALKESQNSRSNSLQETRLVYGLMSFLHSSHEELTHTFIVKVGGRVAQAV